MTKTTTKTADQPKLHLFYHSTVRGISNMGGDKERVYYGKVFRVPRSIPRVAMNPETEWGAIEERELGDLEAWMADTSRHDKKGVLAIGEMAERHEVYDIDTGDIIVMYRVPFKPADEKPARPTTSPPPLSRRARRAAKKQDDVCASLLATPPNLSDDAGSVLARLMSVMDRHADWKLPGDLAVEQRALTLMTLAAHELSKMAPSDHRQAIISQMGMWLDWLVGQHDNQPDVPPLDEAVMEQLRAEGLAVAVEPDDEPVSH